MLLNSIQQNFVFALNPCWVYPDVQQTWMPVLDRMYSPYRTCEDFINSQIVSVNFPGIQAQTATQQIQLYNIQKRPGLTMDQLAQKTLTLTIKTTESYISYFLMRHQFELFLKLVNIQPLYMAPITIDILNDGGYSTVSYVFKQLTMTSISDLQLNYSQTVGNFNTFTVSFAYNYYDVYTIDGKGKHTLIQSDTEPMYDFKQEVINPNDEKYKATLKTAPISSRTRKVNPMPNRVSHNDPNAQLSTKILSTPKK